MAKIARGLPKRIVRDGYKARRLRYKTSGRREYNKARRIVKDARRSYDVREVAIQQARQARNYVRVLSFVETRLGQLGV